MRLPAKLLGLLRPSSAMERLVARSLRDGVGVHRNVWRLTELPLSAADLTTLASDVASWVEAEMGVTRRPYGIDHMAVGLACATPSGEQIASLSLGVFRPGDYYGDGGTREQIEAFVRGLPVEEINQKNAPVRVAAALFSWGDLARATVFQD
ncbi:MAG: hypothetical protein V3V06_02540 [Dehalococcoidia bacterium]